MIWISDTGVKAREAGVHGNRQKQFFFYQTTPLQTLNSDERFHYAEREKKKAASQIQCQVKVNNNKTAATDSDHLNSLTNGFFFIFFY